MKEKIQLSRPTWNSICKDSLQILPHKVLIEGLNLPLLKLRRKIFMSHLKNICVTLQKN